MFEPTDPFHDRCDEYLEGTLSDEGLRELEARLTNDSKARNFFVRYCQLHTDLHLEARSHQAVDRVLANVARVEPVAKPPRRAITWAVSIAASLLCALSLGWWLGVHRPTPAEPGTVAWLVNAQNCLWSNGTVPEDGLKAGTVLSIDSGLAEIRFRSGARIVISGPAQLELVSDNAAKLHRGRLTAKVPESAIGFEVTSPQGKVIDLGTEFGVSVAEGVPGQEASTEVVVFEGKVDAFSPTGEKLSLSKSEGGQLAGGQVKAHPAIGGFVREIVPPPAIVPNVFTLDFSKNIPKTLRDRSGQGTGFTHRLTGTGGTLAANDPNLKLIPGTALELTTTDSDINKQVLMGTGEYFGLKLADYGFTGKEDFELVADFPHIPALRSVGQFGLYAGTKSDRNIRGGLISKDKGEYTQFFVNNNGGTDTDSGFIGLSSTGDDLRVILRRVAGKYSMSVENRTTGNTSTLSIRHPEFLDRENDLYVGVFGANTRNRESKTLTIRRVQVTVWKSVPAEKAARQ